MDQEQISNLIRLCYNGEATEAQKESFLALVRDPANEHFIKEELERLMKSGAVIKMNDTAANEIVQAILAADLKEKAKVVKFGWRWVAAASVIFILGISAYVILSGVEGRHKEQQ